MRHFPLPHLILFALLFLAAVAFTPHASAAQGDSSTPWLDVTTDSNLVYFLYQSPARIERYDLNSRGWLASIPLEATPTAFHVDGESLYVAFGRRISRFQLDGTGETHIRNSNTDITGLFTLNQFLYIQDSSTLTSVNKFSGAFVDSEEHFYVMQGIDIAPNKGKLFARSVNISPADIVSIELYADGTIGWQRDSPSHGDFPIADQTFVFPDESRVADNSGIVYDTDDLTYVNSLAGQFDDLAFHGDSPIVLREGTLVAYSPAMLEIGRYTPPEAPLKIFVRGDSIIAFSAGAQGVAVQEITVNLLQPVQPGAPIDPHRLGYTPDSVLVGNGEIVYLLSRAHRSVFRWSVSARDYLETIPLIETPSHMAYSGETNRLYLAYPSGQITQIRLDESTREEPFANSPQAPHGLATAGEYVFLADPSGAWDSHYTYSPEGSQISRVDWNYYSTEYIWNESNRRMYFLRDYTSPNDLHWEQIDENGVIQAKGESPYHGSEGIAHPIRVAPDGSVAILGSGRIYNAITLEQIDTLSNNINDATWGAGTLFTLRAFGGASQIQKWGPNYRVDTALRVQGAPGRIFTVDEGLLVVTTLGAPQFSIWDFELNEVYQTPVYVTYLPTAFRQ